MSVVVVVTFKEEYQAERAYKQLVDLELEYMMDLEDAVVIQKKHNGLVKYHHDWHDWDTSEEGALGGGIWGALLGLLIGGPYGFLIGGAGGALLGGATGPMMDYGLSKGFIDEVSEKLKCGTSAIFILVRYPEIDTVLEELDNLGGKVHATTLTPENEKHLIERVKTSHRRAA